MRKAIVKIDADPDERLSTADVNEGIRRLEADGVTVNRHQGNHELELGIDSVNLEDARWRTMQVCQWAFTTTPTLGAITFLSRGTDDDALGVIEAFGARAQLERIEEDGEEIAIVTVGKDDRERISESRLHTALEAALNCEIRIRFG